MNKYHNMAVRLQAVLANQLPNEKNSLQSAPGNDDKIITSSAQYYFILVCQSSQEILMLSPAPSNRDVIDNTQPPHNARQHNTGVIDTMSPIMNDHLWFEKKLYRSIRYRLIGRYSFILVSSILPLITN